MGDRASKVSSTSVSNEESIPKLNKKMNSDEVSSQEVGIISAGDVSDETIKPISKKEKRLKEMIEVTSNVIEDARKNQFPQLSLVEKKLMNKLVDNIDLDTDDLLHKMCDNDMDLELLARNISTLTTKGESMNL